jgi:hypothetical protein
MSIAKRDNKGTSRKGRPKIGSIAMTPAERKRRQRQKAKEAKASDPSWLRLRKEIFEYVFNRYVLTNADELASALRAVSCALSVANSQTNNCPSIAKEAFIAIVSPESWDHGAFLPELLQYTPDSVVVAEGFRDRKLVELYRDIFRSHESNEDTDE